jgi:hypothetical protein
MFYFVQYLAEAVSGVTITPFIQEHRNIIYTLFLNTCLNGHLSLRLLADFPLFISRVISSRK